MILLVTALDSEAEGFQQKDGESRLITGIGKVNAAMQLTKRLEFYFNFYKIIDMKVVNLGTAGGIQKPGTITKPEFFCDNSKSADIFVDHYETIGSPDTDIMCCTGDHFEMAPAKHCVYDMEAYALAKVCDNYQVPFHCYKIVTDAGNLDEWRKSLPGHMLHLWTYYYSKVYPGLTK